MPAAYEIVVLDVGGANLAIPFQRAGQADPETVGGISRAYAGNQYSSIIEEFMVVPLVSTRVSSATHAAVKAMFARGAEVPCQAGSAGNVFNGETGVITCSGKLTADMVPGGIDSTGQPLWILNLTLTEVGTALPGTPQTTLFLLTSVTSPSDGTAKVSTPNGSYPGDAGSGLTLGAGLTPPTAACSTPPAPPVLPAVVESATREAAHLSLPLAPGMAFGAPRIQIEYGIVDSVVWSTSSFMAKLSLKRAGATVAGPWSSQWQGMGVLVSGTALLTFGVSLVLPIESGDQFLIEWFARVGLECGQADNAERPFIYVGAVPGPRPNPLLIIGGDLVAL